MAMIACPECETKVSDTAMKCPSCGVQLKVATRGFMGKLFKWVFILFNILMVIWLIGAFNVTGDAINTAGSDAEAAGTAIGAGIGMTMLFMLWVIGDIILGIFVLMTKPKS